MANNFIGEIKIFGGNFAPAGWITCDGQLLNIWEYEALFQVLGTTYGGDGMNTFAVPDLRGRVPVHQSNLGETGGVEQVTLGVNQVPAHRHNVVASSAASSSNPSGNCFATGQETGYSLTASGTLDANAVSPAGAGAAHNNMMPFVAMRYIIAYDGVFPGIALAQQAPGEIRLMTFNPFFSSPGWAPCDGQQLRIDSNMLLFSRIGYTYGGSGSVFNLPNLQGRVVIHPSGSRTFGSTGGATTHTLNLSETLHTHHINAAAEGDGAAPAGGVPAGGTGRNLYGSARDTALNANAVSLAPGGGQAHENRQPFLGLQYHICTAPIGQVDPVPEFVGEVRLLTFVPLEPADWVAAEGQLLPLNQNVALFSLLTTAYGGNGETNFQLPDLRGRVVIGDGTGPGLTARSIGDRGGEESHTLVPNELPAHTHTIACGGQAKGEVSQASGNFPAGSNQLRAWAAAPDGVTTMELVTATAAAHNNMQPYLVLPYFIAVRGAFPSR